ncbi:MAG: prenyltransferase/squalene oxidase repeat-containing protein [Kiritimatiellia bacterium]|nr:prenyltransferase/squalene oxidase repeat-containing protein [Kiritimatiellia bacterium]
MNAPASFRERVHAYLDGLLTGPECETFFQEIRSSPEAAREFARIARLDADLAQALNAAPPVPLPFLTIRQDTGREPDLPLDASTATWWHSRGQPALDHIWGPATAVLLHAAVLLLILRWTFPSGERPVSPSAPVQLSRRPEPLEHFDARLQESAREQTLRPSLSWIPGSTDEPDPRTGFLPSLTGLLGPEPPDLSVAPERTGSGSDRNIGFPGIAHFDSTLLLPGPFGGRRADGRAEQHAYYAPAWGRRGELAAQIGMNWLAGRQQPDGAWPRTSENPVRLAALSAASFLSFAPVPSETTGQAALHAIRFIETQQLPDGRFDPDPGAHALATLVLAETWALWRLPAGDVRLNRAIEALVREPSPAASWASMSPERASSGIGWQAQALAQLIRLYPEREDLRPAAARLIAQLKTLHDPASGVFAFSGARTAEDRNRMTAAAVSALTVLGEPHSPECVRGRRRLLRQSPRVLAAELADHSPEHLFFLFDALTARPQTDSLDWMARAAETVARLQDTSGAWTTATHQPDERRTAAAALALTAHLRHTPPAGSRTARGWLFDPARLLATLFPEKPGRPVEALFKKGKA